MEVSKLKKLKISWEKFFLYLTFITLIIFPLIFSPHEYPFLMNIIVWSLFYGYLGSAWNILSGFAGQFSFGHAAFVGLGAYVTAILYVNFNVSPWIGMWIAAAISICMSLAIGLPSLRVKAPYFIIVTIAFSEILRYTFLNWVPVTGGGMGLAYEVIDFSIFAFQFNIDKRVYYYIMLGMALAIVYTGYILKKSKWGYYFMAIREDELLAAVSGINTTRYKLLATLISAFFTSLAGTFFVQFVLYIDPDIVMSLQVMTRIMLPAAFGGLGTIMGPWLGAFIVVPLGEILRAYVPGIQGLHLLIYGLLLMVVAVALPHGIYGTFIQKRHALERTRALERATN